jgi:hypothetical protein
MTLKTKLRKTVDLYTKQDDQKLDKHELDAVLRLGAKVRGGLKKDAVSELTKLYKTGETSFESPEIRQKLFNALIGSGVEASELGVVHGAGTTGANSDFASMSKKEKMTALLPDLKRELNASNWADVGFYDYLSLDLANGVTDLSLDRHRFVSNLPVPLRTRASEITETIEEMGPHGPWTIDPTIDQLVRNGEVVGFIVHYDMSGPGYQAVDSRVYDTDLEYIGGYGYND